MSGCWDSQGLTTDGESVDQMKPKPSLFQNLKLKKHRVNRLMCSGDSMAESDEVMSSLESSEFDLTSQHSSSDEEDSGYCSNRVIRRKRIRCQQPHKGDSKGTTPVKGLRQENDSKSVEKQLPQFNFAYCGFPSDMVNAQNVALSDTKVENGHGRASIGFIPVLTHMVPQFPGGVGETEGKDSSGQIKTEQPNVNAGETKPIILTQFPSAFIMTAKGPVPVISSYGPGGIPQLSLLNVNDSNQKKMEQLLQMVTPEQLAGIQASRNQRESKNQTNALYTKKEQPKSAPHDYSFIDHYTNGQFVYKGILKKSDCATSETDPVPMATVSQAYANDEQEEQLICAICNDRATGLHYGIITCEGCKGFFKRTVQNKRVYNCVGNGNCEINKLQRNRCQFCRFKKCLQMGMVLAAVREDRMPGGRNSGAVYNLYKVKYKKHKKKDQMVKLFKEQVAQIKVGSSDGKIETEMITERKRMPVPFRVSFDKEGIPQIVSKENRSHYRPSSTFSSDSTSQHSVWESDMNSSCFSEESAMSQEKSYARFFSSKDSICSSEGLLPLFQNPSPMRSQENQCYIPTGLQGDISCMTSDPRYTNDSAGDRKQGSICQRNDQQDPSFLLAKEPPLAKDCNRANGRLVSLPESRFPTNRMEELPLTGCHAMSRDPSGCHAMSHERSVITQDNIVAGLSSKPHYSKETETNFCQPKCMKDSDHNQTSTDHVHRLNNLRHLLNTKTTCDNNTIPYSVSSNDSMTNEADDNSYSKSRNDTYKIDWSDIRLTPLSAESDYKHSIVKTTRDDQQQRHSSEVKSQDSSWITVKQSEMQCDANIKTSHVENTDYKAEKVPVKGYVSGRESANAPNSIQIQNLVEECHSLENKAQSYKHRRGNPTQKSYRERRHSHGSTRGLVQKGPPQERTQCCLQPCRSTETLTVTESSQTDYNSTQRYLQDQYAIQQQISSMGHRQQISDTGINDSKENQHSLQMMASGQQVIATCSDTEGSYSSQRVDTRTDASDETVPVWSSWHEKYAGVSKYQQDVVNNINRESPACFQTEQHLTETRTSCPFSTTHHSEDLNDKNRFHCEKGSYKTSETGNLFRERDHFKYEPYRHTKETPKDSGRHEADDEKISNTSHWSKRNLQDDHLMCDRTGSNTTGMCLNEQHALPPPEHDPKVHRQLMQELMNCNSFLDISGSYNFDQFDWIKSDLASNLCRLGDEIVGKLVDWTRHLPFYNEIPLNVHSELLANRWHELLVLITTAQRALSIQELNSTTDVTYKTLLNANMLKLERYLSRMYKEPVNLDELKVQNIMERMAMIMFSFLQMRVGLNELVSLQVILLLSHSSSLNCANIENIRDRYTGALEWYVNTKFPHDPTRLDELMARLPEVQTTSRLLLKSKMIYIPFFLNS